MTPQPAPRYSAPRRPRRRRGCLTNLGLALFLTAMLPVFCCGVSLVLYLVFPPAPMDVVVMGLDARDGEGFATRTDSLLLLGADASQLRMSLLSIPRDVFIDTPGYEMQRINTVNVLGELEAAGRGPALLSDAIAANFDIDIDRYIRMDFDAFTDLVDAVGGISINVERTLVDNAYPTADGGTIAIRFDPGWQQMDGERALQYARTRHSDDDYRRAERQQQVITAVSLKLLNPFNWGGVVRVFNDSVDTDLTLWDMIVIAPNILINAGRFDRLVIDRDTLSASADGYVIPDYAQLAPWLAERFD